MTEPEMADNAQPGEQNYYRPLEHNNDQSTHNNQDDIDHNHRNGNQPDKEEVDDSTPLEVVTNGDTTNDCENLLTSHELDTNNKAPVDGNSAEETMQEAPIDAPTNEPHAEGPRQHRTSRRAALYIHPVTGEKTITFT